MKNTKSNGRAVEISLIDLLKHILYKWRVILIWMLIMVALTGLFCVYKNIQTNKDIDVHNASISVETKVDDQTSNVTLDNIYIYCEQSELNTDEISKIEIAVNLYNQLQQYYDYASQNNQQLDVLEFSEQQVIEYDLSVIGNENNSANLANNIAYCLSQFVQNGGVVNAILEAGYNGMAKEDLGNNIELNYEKIEIKSDDLASLNISANIPFFIICKGEDAENLATYVDQVMQKQSTTYAYNGTVSLNLINQYSTLSSDNPLEIKQASIRDNIANVENEFKNFTSSFNSNQIIIFNEIVGQDYLNLPENETSEVISLEIKDHISLTTGLVKFLIIGLFGGIFIPCCWYAFFYIMDGTVKTKEEFEDLFDLYCLGDITSIKQHRGIDKLLDKIFGVYEEPMEYRQQMLLANIKAICIKQNCKEICLTTTTVLSEDVKTKIKEICDQLQNEGITANYYGNILSNVVGFESMVSCGSVALIEQTTASKINNLDKLATICSEHHVDVIGVINC